MERIVQKVAFPYAPCPQVTRVAAYARVSTGKDAMLHSLSAQVSYYSDLIQKHKGWAYAGVYADEALTGTKDSRENFQRLLTDCRAGKIDRVITKSISRFARNTVTLLETVRELKSLGVSVYFEEQNIDTTTADGELMMTILASYAQEESLSASENLKWRVRQNFKAGIPWDHTLLGYRCVEGTYQVQPEEAQTVRCIFSAYLAGKGVATIMKELNAQGARTRFGGEWTQTAVWKVLRNYTYTGNLLLQKTFRPDHISKKDRPNRGELPQYHAEGTHEAIIPMETFLAVQAEIERRAAKHYQGPPHAQRYAFTSLVVCGRCGKHYKRKTTRGVPLWTCPTYDALGKGACPSRQVPEAVLEQAAAAALGLEHFDPVRLQTEVETIRVLDDHTLEFVMKNGTRTAQPWAYRSRSASWTPEKRDAARQKEYVRRNAS